MSTLARQLGIEFPLFAFSHCRDVVAAVSRAGGYGVLGAANFTPEQLEAEMAWIDAHIEGRPYGIDIMFPEHMPERFEPEQMAELLDRVPDQHVDFVTDLLASHGVAVVPPGQDRRSFLAPPPPTLLWGDALRLLEVAMRHPVTLVVNALGAPPPVMVAAARAKGAMVGALAGSARHAERCVAAGAEVIVAQGGEAGGHCGEVATLVLIPEVVRAMRRYPGIHVLAAGGITTGEQMAACVAMGAAGAWTGSVWLSTPESEVSQTFREKMVAATSRDTVRSRGRTGKPSRQLKSAWTEAWEAGTGPKPLAMPLQSVLTEGPLHLLDREADKGHAGARALVSYFVGQGVGLVEQIRPAERVVQDFREGFAEALGRVDDFVAGMEG